jgi:glutamine synthetase
MMKNYTKEEILKISKEEKISYIRLQFTDMLGTIKAVEIPLSKLEDALNNKIMFDGSSIEGFVRIMEADMYLYPDLNSWMILEFENSNYGKVARMICDVYLPNGKPFKGDPRFILKQVVKKMKDVGFEHFHVGFEPEFFLFKKDAKGEPSLESSDQGSYFDLSPLDGNEYVRRDICLELEKLGFVVQTAHHEVAPGQNEINFKFADVVTACDNVQTFKQVVKVVAAKHNLVASFMPKPIETVNGSGMHTNCSLADKDGNNIFYDEKDPMNLSLTCRKFIHGVLTHARYFAAITNPTVNSYKRLIPGYEAPCYTCWSDANRSSLIRIPAVRKESTRIEIRNVDPLANPYLALSVILQSGLDGIVKVNEKDLIKPVSDNIFSLTRKERENINIQNLPENLKDAIEEMQKDPLIKDVLGEHTYNKYILAKELEWNEYRKIISDWELKKYLQK